MIEQRAMRQRRLCSGRIVGYDSNRVLDESRNDKIGILSHATAQPGLDSAAMRWHTAEDATSAAA
jgi:hypothetical protein